MKIQFQNVGFCYESRKGKPSVTGLNFTVESGEFILICGPSGSGKSTVERILNGLAPGFYRGELSGSVFFDGKDITTIPQTELAGFVGSVFQNPHTQFFDTNSTGEMAFGCENMGYPKEKIREQIHKASNEFGLAGLLDRDLFQLSGGEKQKIACGSICAVDPDIYVFDEPSSNLDHDSIRALAAILKSLKAAGKTVILMEHRIYYASSLADRVFYMREGQIETVYERQEFEALDTDTLHQMGLRSVRYGEIDTGTMKKQTGAVKAAVLVESMKYSYVKGLSGPKHALALQGLELPEGKIIALIGKNGAGKSTFLKCMCGLERREKARISRYGQAFARRQRLKDSYLVMQDVNHQLFAESVEGELRLSDPAISKEQMEELLADFDLLPYAKDHPMSLSGGQKQRVAAAAACAAGKRYLYLDEPTSGLDYMQMKNMGRAIGKLREKVCYVLIVTHDPEFILECCDYVIELEEGKVKRHYPMAALS